MMISTRIDEYRASRGLTPLGSSQCYRWCLLSIVLAVFVWTQAMNHLTRLYESPASSEVRVVSTNQQIENITESEEAVQDTVSAEAASPLNVVASAKNVSQENQSVPQVIWLMSFPNSGTTYTNKLVQGVSNTTTATNYGQEQSGYKTSIPISPDLPDGPFFRYPDWSYSKYILTKTHCGGYCIRCSPGRYVLDAKKFETECRSGNKKVKGKDITTRSAYSPSLPRKAVHIIRNPFDNLVARLHHQRKSWSTRDNKGDFLETFESTKDGFRKWCQFVDYTSAATTKDMEVLDNATKALFENTPCAADVYRWTQFHNLAVEVTEDRLKIPVQYIFYENYTDNFNDTVSEVLDFLELPAVSTAPPFIKGKEYPEYFTEDDRYHIAQLVQHLATNQSWPLLSHYFDGLLDNS